jgi:hypothetical protein
MSFDPVSALFSVGQSVIERIWPDPNKRAEELRKLEDLKQRGDLAQLEAHVKLLTGQLEINKVEAQHKSIFVAGWRPFTGWVGGVSLAYMGVIEPLLRFIALLSGYNGEFPVLDTSVTLPVLMGMLGIGAMRSYDKKNGAQTDSIKNN